MSRVTTVHVSRGGAPGPLADGVDLAGLPRRFTLPEAALRVLHRRVGTPWPWAESAPPPDLEAALGQPPVPSPHGRPPADEEAATVAAETTLRRLGLVVAKDEVHPEVRGALAVLAAPEVSCDLDLSVVRPGAARGFAPLHARHGLREGRVTAVSSAGGPVELAWLADDHWQTELARCVSVTPPPESPPPPARVLEVPFDVLLGTAEALREGRDDVVHELAGRAVGLARDADGDLDHGAIVRQLVLLHRGTVGRLLATVATGAGPGPSHGRDGVRAGWVSWVLVADGWRSLTPVVRDGEPLVRVAPVEPLDLGRRLVPLVTAVRSRS